jgi:hypothetical protein
VAKNFRYLLILMVAVLGSTVARAQVTVIIEQNIGAAATKDFKFKTVKPPAKEDAATKAKLTLLVGQIDPAGGDLTALTDGLVPAGDDEPKSNFAFDSGSSGGRFSMDLGAVIDIKQINTYSWHSGARAGQVYMLYASDGATPDFCAEPNGDIDPTACGWKLITGVDSRRKHGDGLGQYGVSISEARGSLGKYRYLLFRCSATETEDDEGNTFYSEIDVIAKKQ